jgi:uncharacterized protein YbjT (DUF2867 family)
MQNVLARLEEVRSEGVYRVPYSVGTRISMVDLVDVAECAALVLTEPDYVGGTFELVGPGDYSQVEIARGLAEVVGASVRAEEIPLDGWKRQAERVGLGEYAIETLIRMFNYYDQYSFMGNPKVLEVLLGRAPTSFEDFLRREI